MLPYISVWALIWQHSHTPISPHLWLLRENEAYVKLKGVANRRCKRVMSRNVSRSTRWSMKLIAAWHGERKLEWKRKDKGRVELQAAERKHEECGVNGWDLQYRKARATSVNAIDSRNETACLLGFCSILPLILSVSQWVFSPLQLELCDKMHARTQPSLLSQRGDFIT